MPDLCGRGKLPLLRAIWKRLLTLSSVSLRDYVYCQTQACVRGDLLDSRLGHAVCDALIFVSKKAALMPTKAEPN